jgi:hypothetical protein
LHNDHGICCHHGPDLPEAIQTFDVFFVVPGAEGALFFFFESGDSPFPLLDDGNTGNQNK